MATRPRIQRAPRILAAALLAVLGLLPSGLAGIRPAPAALAGTGGCAPASSTCFLFDVSLSGTGFGTYRTKDPVSNTYTRIVCEYGNEAQAGVCGWGYEVSTPGNGFKVLYSLLPDPGSQACQGSVCYGAGEFEGFIDIYGNYAEGSWTFELINHVQIDVVVEGTGSGSVTSDPVGIDCPDDCDDLFAAGLPVTLTAMPAPGSVLTQWEGACTGTSTTCVVTPEFLQSVTARFNLKATAPPPTKRPTPEPTDEPTEPTDEPTEGASAAATAESSPSVGPPTAPGSTDPAGSEAVAPSPSDTPAPAPVASSGNLPVVIGLTIALIVLIGGTIFVVRRGRPTA